MSSYTDELAERRQQGLWRQLRQLPDDMLDLASNDYLHLARHPQVIEAGIHALQQYGAGGRASRLVSGNLPPHQSLEATIARFKHSEAALVFPSGYHANLSVVTSLAAFGDLVFCDKRNHASLIDACRLASAGRTVIRYFDSTAKLRNLLKSTFEAHSEQRRFIVSDGVFSMDGDVADLPTLLTLAEEFDALLLLDDAHGTGTLGATGRGTAEHFKIAHHDRLIQIGTFSKAIGGQGGFVATSQEMIDWIINNARPFIYTTALNPASCAAAKAAFDVIDDQPKIINDLREITTELAQGLQELGFNAHLQPSPIIPVIVGEAHQALALSEALSRRGIWCPAIRPPTVPRGKSRLRVAANLSLTPDLIAKVLSAFAAAAAELRLAGKHN